MDKSLRPPEVILGSGYNNPRVDIWMLGCCVCFFLSYFAFRLIPLITSFRHLFFTLGLQTTHWEPSCPC